MLADTTAALTKALEPDLDLAAVIGSVWSKRCMVENRKVSKLNIEPDGIRFNLQPG